MTYYALLAFFVFEYLRPGSYIPGLDQLRLNTLVPLAAISGTILLRSPVSNQQFAAALNTKVMAVFLGMLAVSTFFATVTLEAFDVLKNVFAYLLIYWILVRQVGDVERLKGVFATLTLIHVAIAALNPEIFTNTSGRSGINSGAFLGDGNDFSLSVNVCVPFCLFLLLEAHKKLHKGFWLAALLILVMSVVATKSRGGTLALALIGAYFWLRSERKVLTAALAVVAVTLVFATAPPEYFERMSMMTDTEESSAEGRIVAWKSAIQMAARNPIMGVGAGHFGMAFGSANASRWVTAHSIYFLLLGELGVPGLTLLVFVIASNLVANRLLLREAKRRGHSRISSVSNLLACTSASLVAFAVAGAFLSAAYYPHLYVICGVMTAARGIVRRELESQRSGDRAAATSEAALVGQRAVVRSDAISSEWRAPRIAGDVGHHPG